MSKTQPRTRQTIREFVRRLFTHRWTFLGCLIVGAVAGYVHAWRQTTTFAGSVELATDQAGPRSSPHLPDPLRLRRLLLNPANLCGLLPGSPAAAEPAHEALIHAVVASLKVEAIPATERGTRAVHRVQLEIPAESWSSAEAQLLAYVQRLQQDFEAAPTEVAARSPVSKHRRTDVVDGAIRLTSFADDEAEKKGPAPAAADPPELARLKEMAQTLGVSLWQLDDTIRSTRQRASTTDAELKQLEREARKRDELASRLENPAQRWLVPVEVLKEVHGLTPAMDRFDALQRKRTQLATTLTAAHPQRKALEREIAETRQRVDQLMNEMARRVRASKAELAAEIERLRGEQRQMSDRLSGLVKLAEGLREFEVKRKRVPGTEPLPLTLSTAQELALSGKAPIRIELLGPAATAPTVAPPASDTPSVPAPPRMAPIVATTPGKLLVAGPFLERTPIRPHPLRDGMLGAGLGALFGLLLVTIRSGADQRVLVPQDLEFLEPEVIVFGSIPRLKRTAPVELVADEAAS